MNLTLSGHIRPTLLNAVVNLSRPTRIIPLHERAWRLESVDDSGARRLEVTARCSIETVDHAYVESHVRFSNIKLLVMDMDSTLITIECIDEMADYAGKRAEVAAITEATMNGEIKDFSESLKRRVALLEGLDVDAMRCVYEQRLQISPGAEALLRAARDTGAYLLLVSGGFTYFADRLKSALGFDAAYANELETCDGKLTGRLLGEVIDSSAKAERVRHAMKVAVCNGSQTLVIGDGANDIPMMLCVDQSIAYHAKKTVRDVSSMTICYGSLAVALDYLV